MKSGMYSQVYGIAFGVIIAQSRKVIVKMASSYRNRTGCFEQDAGLSLGFQPHPVKAESARAKLSYDAPAGANGLSSGMDTGLASMAKG
jgi:hypothetical protein